MLPIVAKLDLDLPQQSALNNLKSAIELLHQCQSKIPNLKSHIHLDLSLIQTFDYYTGIVFEVVSSSKTGQRVLGQGGRYDQLLGLFDPQGQNSPGIGFCLNIEDLHQVLLTEGQLPTETPASDWLVVPLTPEASAARVCLRSPTPRVYSPSSGGNRLGESGDSRVGAGIRARSTNCSNCLGKC